MARYAGGTHHVLRARGGCVPTAAAQPGQRRGVIPCLSVLPTEESRRPKVRRWQGGSQGVRTIFLARGEGANQGAVGLAPHMTNSSIVSELACMADEPARHAILS